MTIPLPVLQILHRRDFWLGNFFKADPPEPFPELAGSPIACALPGNYELRLSINADSLNPTVSLAHPSLSATVELGWDDQAHWHPDLFRWEELDAVCRCVAADEPELPHPGWPLLLLYRFAPATPDDDAIGIASTIRRAWESAAVLEPSEYEPLIAAYDRRDRDYEWLYSRRRGWSLEGEDVYSLRTMDNSEFPYRLFGDMMVRVFRRVGGSSGL
jgi:hypothetical protein